MPDVVAVEEEKPVFHHVRVGLPGGTVHQLELGSDAQLSAVVLHVLQAENVDPASVRVRLIIAGKLHNDHAQLLKDVVPDGGFIHCAITDAPPVENDQAAETDSEVLESRPANSNEVRIPLEAYNVNGEVRIVIPNITSQTAVDRLTQAGFTAEEIRMIRRHLRLLRREARVRQELRLDRIAENGELIDPSDPSGPALQPERTLVTLRPRPHTTNLVFTSGGEGTNADFLIGCICGYLLGIIVLGLLLDNNATKRWRVGIIAGIATNCAFGVLRASILSTQTPFAGP